MAANFPQTLQAPVSALVALGEEIEQILASTQNTNLTQPRARIELLYGPHGDYVLAVVPAFLAWLDEQAERSG